MDAMNLNEAYEFIKKSLNELPDSTGILRCVLFADLLRVVNAFYESATKQIEAQKEEKLILEARLRDLEEENTALKTGRKEQ